jgi:predicted dehydrogenase
MTHRVVMAGAGYFAAHQLQAWQDLGVVLAGLCDLDLPKGEALAQRFGVERVSANWEALLDSAEPTVVDNCTPPGAHTPLVRAALKRGLPIICQKPFGKHLAEARELVHEAEQAGVPLVVHENFRFMPWFRECRRLLDAGLLGAVHGISFRLRPGDGQGPRAYLDRQPYFQTQPQLLVRETGVHHIDTFRYLMGEVVAVTARLRRLNPVIAGEDAALVIFEFASAATGLFDGNRLNDHVAQDPRRTMGEMWLEGSAGVLRLDGDARLWFKPHHAEERAHVYDAGDQTVFGGACRALQAHVLRHLERGELLQNAGRDYLRNREIEAAIYQSHDSGQRVALPPLVPSSTTP